MVEMSNTIMNECLRTRSISDALSSCTGTIPDLSGMSIEARNIENIEIETPGGKQGEDLLGLEGVLQDATEMAPRRARNAA